MSEAISAGHDPLATTEPRTVPFRFHATGSEYFRIWIINLVLTILTLGVYSAWAKVRTKRYFYGNTELAGDRFDYLANPVTILKGRLIAIAALAVYTVTQIFFPPASAVLLIVLMCCMPWIIVRSLRFNAIMSAWRGIRFGYDGEAGGAFVTFLLWPLFGVVTFGFGLPYAWYKQNHFLINNYRFGQSRAASSTEPGGFYLIFFALFGAGIAAAVVLAILGTAAAFASSSTDQASDEAGAANLTFMLIMSGYFIMYIGIYVLYQAMYFRLVYNNIAVGNNRTGNDVSVPGWFGVVIVNAVLLVLTLGFYYPWASVRMNRYIFSHLWVQAEDLDAFIADETDNTSALGEELGEAFDLGIGV